MRYSTIAAALAAAPAVVSAAGSMGFSLGVNKADGSCKDASDYESDFDAIASNSDAKIVRTYAASSCNGSTTMLPVAKSKGFKVLLGIWPDVETSYNDDLNAIKAVASTYKDSIYAVTVGSETLYRGNFTGEELKDKILDVKSALPDGIKVGTADTYNKFADGTADALIGTADILLFDAYSFWQGAGGDNATTVFFNDMYEGIKHIESVSTSSNMPEIWVGETGWPTATGTNYGDAKGGLDNAKSFFQDAFCGYINWGYNAFYFEAFDEPWKPDSTGTNGDVASEKTWGAMTVDRSAKFSLKC